MTEGTPQRFTITKRYSRKITQNYQSWEFSSEMTTEVEVSSGKDLMEANDKLFQQVKYLCEEDIAKVFPPVEGE